MINDAYQNDGKLDFSLMSESDIQKLLNYSPMNMENINVGS
jgi:hypothetical protein